MRTWPSLQMTELYLFSLFIPPGQLIVLEWLLGWPFYNFNCSKTNRSASLFGKAQQIRQIAQVAARYGSRKAIPAVASGLHSCKVTAAISAPPNSISDSKSNKLVGQENNTTAPSISALTEIQTPMYTEADLLRIFKIFSETNGQTQLEVPCERPVKAKLSDIYSGKLHIDCFYFCQKCEDYFETTGATRSNRTLFAALFLHEKINFWWH